MRLIKLDAIESTNEFLKKLAVDQPVENYTVVTAENQTKGKGQMGATWQSQAGKNLIMSILVNEVELDPAKIFLLNVAVALALANVLEANNLAQIRIKWPNDIMAYEKKIAGILIENSFSGESVRSVIGIGLNVNQSDFTELPRASSLANVTGREWDRDLLLTELVDSLKAILTDLASNETQLLADYNTKLFRRGVTTEFESAQGIFNGKIVGVADDGLLQISNSEGQIISYSLKQLEMRY